MRRAFFKNGIFIRVTAEYGRFMPLFHFGVA